MPILVGSNLYAPSLCSQEDAGPDGFLYGKEMTYADVKVRFCSATKYAA